MEQEIFKFLAGNGIFAALFVWLLMDTRKENAKREKENAKREEGYKKLLEETTQTNRLLAERATKDINEIKEDVEQIKEILK